MEFQLSSEIGIKVRKALLKCEQFNSDDSLRAVFAAGDLAAIKWGLRSANTVPERVDLNVAYLLEKHLSGGQPALPIFLVALRDRYEVGDALRDELDVLFKAMINSAVKLRPPPDEETEQKVCELLLGLNFEDHLKAARKAIQSHRIGAFLVHGKPNCEHKVLLTRLLRLCPKRQTAKVIQIDVSSDGIGKSSEAMWRQVAAYLNPDGDSDADPDPKEITEKICQWWRTKDVLFIFSTVDYMPVQLLSSWISDFWQPIVEAAEDKSEQNGTALQTYLLMIMVDYSGDVPSWGIPLAERADDPLYPKIPFRLPPIEPFEEKEIGDWLPSVLDRFPLEAVLDAKKIWEESRHGMPTFVFRRICKLYDPALKWEGGVARWLR